MNSPELAMLASLAVALLIAAGLIIYYRIRRRGDPEALRRARIDANGRFIEGMVIDFQAGVVFYRWSWRGVQYEASQDLRSLAHLLPESENLLIGPVTVKFLAKDPSNSIVMSERWSGFRALQGRSTPES
jgi:hypothetical protein